MKRIIAPCLAFACLISPALAEPAMRPNPTLYPTVLICPGALAPRECVPENAIDVITAIQPSQLPAMCLGYAEMQLARTTVVQPGTYLKVMCEVHRS